LPGGDPGDLYDSLTNKLKMLEDRTVLCPGHHYAEPPTSTLGEEKATNPFLRVPTREAFLRLAGAA
jgi:glyoxylase-like metal-dependent hydrolase (beta-lactamase superfamily II)